MLHPSIIGEGGSKGDPQLIATGCAARVPTHNGEDPPPAVTPTMISAPTPIHSGPQMTARKPATPGQTGPALHWQRIRRRPRFSLCSAVFALLVAGLILAGMRPALGVLLAFDIAAVIYLGLTLHMICRADADSMHRRARAEDEGYWGFLLSSAAGTVVTLVALAIELHAGKNGGIVDIVLAVCTLLLTWLFFNTIFALHYAHEFYGDSGGKDGGLDFPGTKKPDYWDFVYFAFVIGMTFQVSDVQISERKIRRVALVHAVIAFFFNVIIVALSVNIVASSA